LGKFLLLCSIPPSPVSLCSVPSFASLPCSLADVYSSHPSRHHQRSCSARFSIDGSSYVHRMSYSITTNNTAVMLHHFAIEHSICQVRALFPSDYLLLQLTSVASILKHIGSRSQACLGCIQRLGYVVCLRPPPPLFPSRVHSTFRPLAVYHADDYSEPQGFYTGHVISP
jgi:hypothetical protein